MTDGSSRPDPPSDWPAYIRDGVGRQPPEMLFEIAAYAERLAQWKLEQAADDVQSGDRRRGEPAETVPEDWPLSEQAWVDAVESARDTAFEKHGVRPDGAVLRKTIDGNDYHYLEFRVPGENAPQWTYIAPARPSSSSDG
jgi:hypothetical protein